MYIERFPFVPTIGRYPPGTDGDTIDYFQSLLERLQASSVATIPEALQIEYLEKAAVKSGADVFSTAIEIMNTSIARGLLCPDLLGFTSMKGPGSYALGKKHFDVFLWILQRLGTEFEELLNEQLIYRLVNYNFDVKKYPKFKFIEISEVDLKTRLSIIMGLAKLELIDKNAEWVLDYLDLPRNDNISEFAEEARKEKPFSRSLTQAEKFGELRRVNHFIQNKEKGLQLLLAERLKEISPELIKQVKNGEGLDDIDLHEYKEELAQELMSVFEQGVYDAKREIENQTGLKFELQPHDIRDLAQGLYYQLDKEGLL